MYQPPLFRETRSEILHELIRAYPLGLLVSVGTDGPVADLMPFLLDPKAGTNGRLLAHMARANPQWRIIGENPGKPVLVVFQGVNTYVTPSWYETKRQTGKVVPTWNYATVQIRGMARIIDDRDWLAWQINELTEKQESARSDPWHVSDAPEPFIESQVKAIIGMEIAIESIEGKWKVSQNRPEVDRKGVIEGLEASPDTAGAVEMAKLVRRFGTKPGD
jgi:transcriptional regulator